MSNLNDWKLGLIFLRSAIVGVVVFVCGMFASTTGWCGPGAAESAPQPKINVVFDLNGVTMDGWKPTPKFDQMLSVLASNPRYRIFFFSTQSTHSIREQIYEIRLADGRYADEIAKIYNGSHMTDLDDIAPPPGELNKSMNARPNSPRPQKYSYFGGVYKDLRILAQPGELANTILVDDTFEKAHPNQIANLLYLHPDAGYTEPEAPAPVPPVIPPTKTMAGPSPPSKQTGGIMAHIMSIVSFLTSPPEKPRKQTGAAVGKGSTTSGSSRNDSSEIVSSVSQTAMDRHDELVRERSRRNWLRGENRRADLILGLIETARVMSEKNGTSVSEALSQIQFGEVLAAGQQPQDLKLLDRAYVATFIERGRKIREASIGSGRNFAAEGLRSTADRRRCENLFFRAN